jgi:hypothetical protein
MNRVVSTMTSLARSPMLYPRSLAPGWCSSATVQQEAVVMSTRSLLGRAVFVLCAIVLMTAFTVGIRSASGSQSTPGATPASAFTAADAISQVTGEDGVLRFDVAENANPYVWSGQPELVDGRPTHATPFLTLGYIYPEGTLTESNGVLPDGSPEFPDQVLGQWTCYGWWFGDADHAGQSAPWLTTHLFNFGGAWGEATLVSEGYSIDEFDVPLERAIVGGTGVYAGALGVQVETNVGINATDGVNFRYEIRLSGE